MWILKGIGHGKTRVRTRLSLGDILLIIGLTILMMGGLICAFQYYWYACGVREHLHNDVDGTEYIPEQAAGNQARRQSGAMAGWIALGGLGVTGAGYVIRRRERSALRVKAQTSGG